MARANNAAVEGPEHEFSIAAKAIGRAVVREAFWAAKCG